MPGKPGRFIALPLGLLLFGSIGCRKQDDMQMPPGCGASYFVITVDSTGHAQPDTVDLDKTCHQVAFWVGEDRTKKLFIEFEEEGPFKDMKKKGNRWRVECQDWTCFSRHIKTNASGGGKKYKYWQVLENPDGTPAVPPVDAWIVIKP